MTDVLTEKKGPLPVYGWIIVAGVSVVALRQTAVFMRNSKVKKQYAATAAEVAGEPVARQSDIATPNSPDSGGTTTVTSAAQVYGDRQFAGMPAKVRSDLGVGF